jgi:quercetin dioxygenase-like cupin family protein
MRIVNRPALIPAPLKVIEEYIGRVNTRTGAISIARMLAPAGWKEPGQRPEFDEYTVVLKGALNVETENGKVALRAGEASIAPRGEWVRYSTDGPEEAEYIAVCLPAFSPDMVHRDGTRPESTPVTRE